MKYFVKYSPVKNLFENSKLNFFVTTDDILVITINDILQIQILDTDTVRINGVEIKKNEDGLFNNYILTTYLPYFYKNEDNDFYVNVCRMYTESCKEWDTGEYFEIIKE